MDCADIAAAAALLTGDPHPGETFVLTGPEALTHDEIAGKLSAVVGREIRYVDLPVAAFAGRLTALGLPLAFAEAVAVLFADVAGGNLTPTTTAVTELTGRPARTFDQFLYTEADTIRRAWSAMAPARS